jgi:hypothetical protein
MATSYLKRLFWFLRKPLAVELAEACEAVEGLRKSGHNDDLDFDYLKILDLAEELRAELLPRGIAIIPNDLECIEKSWSTAEGITMTEVRVKTEFEVTDGHRRIVKSAYGGARDSNGYAIAIAQTMALKSWLKRTAMIFGKEDDAELGRWAPYPGEAAQVRTYQGRALNAALRTCGLTKEGAEALLTKIMGFPITTEGIADLPRKDFDVAMAALTKHQDMAEVLELSKDIAKAKKPQPVVAVMDRKVRDEAMTGD